MATAQKVASWRDILILTELLKQRPKWIPRGELASPPKAQKQSMILIRCCLPNQFKNNDFATLHQKPPITCVKIIQTILNVYKQCGAQKKQPEFQRSQNIWSNHVFQRRAKLYVQYGLGAQSGVLKLWDRSWLMVLTTCCHIAVAKP